MKERLNGTVRAGLSRINMKDLREPSTEERSNLELQFSDRFEWQRLPDRLRVECVREQHFIPACNFEMEAAYFVEHFLSDGCSLDDLSDEQIEAELSQNLPFYLQESQGFMARLSLLIGQITATFGGVPVLLPPSFCKE